VIEALGFAGGPLSQAGRDWLAGLGPVQEDTVGAAPDSPVLGWAGIRPFGPAEAARLRQAARFVAAPLAALAARAALAAQHHCQKIERSLQLAPVRRSRPPTGKCREQKAIRRLAMSLRINSEAPDFTAETTQGTIHFHDWIGNSWAILFSHPKDFTPVCTTELGYMAGLMPQFERRNTKIIGLSVDPIADHARWAKDIEETQGHAVTYPMIGDPELKVAKVYDMLPEDAGGTAEGRTAADNATVRSVFVVGPDKKIKAMLTYPMSTGRNFDEVLRLLDSCQLTAKHSVATPVNWKVGEDVIIPPAISDEQAKQKFPNGWKTIKPYLRVVAQPPA
jgi:alkyl hydroperoxide reductase subunit AhpC